MELLTGEMHIDQGQTPSARINTEGYSALFDAAGFNSIGAGAGSSDLALTSTVSWFIGFSMVFGYQADFYANGAGSAVLVDNADSTAGHWTMNTPLYVARDDRNFSLAISR